MSIDFLPSSTALELFAIGAPGLERALFQELCAICPQAKLVQTPEGCTVVGDLETLYRLNLHSRLSTRVLLRVGKLRALHFPELRRKVAQLPWPQFAKSAVRLRVSASAHRCRLIHTGALIERVELAVADSGVTPTDDPDAPLLHVFVRGQADQFTLSVDTSGELLHRRGYRQEDGGAPLRETLAPALLALANFSDATALCDPMCGSGTLAIEAALVALRRAPGLQRSFAFFDWPGFSPSLWQKLREESQAAERRTLPQPIWASDRDPKVIEIARRNAERAGVAEYVSFAVCAVAQLRLPPVETGLILCNPPYGKRLHDPQLVETYRSLLHLWRRSPGFQLAVFTPSAKLAAAAGTKTCLATLHNGGLRVGLYGSEPVRESAAVTLF